MSMPYPPDEMPRMPETLTLSDYPEEVKKLLPHPDSEDPPNCSPIIAAVIFQLLNDAYTKLDVSPISSNVNAEPNANKNKDELTIQIVTTQNPESLYYPEGWYYDGDYLVKGANRRMLFFGMTTNKKPFHLNEYYCIPIIWKKGK